VKACWVHSECWRKRELGLRELQVSAQRQPELGWKVACWMKLQVLLAITKVSQFQYMVANAFANLGDHAHNEPLLLDTV
jgi:hypothetical protein